MMFFGPQAKTIRSSSLPSAPTPEGLICNWCGVPFVAGDTGVLMPILVSEANGTLMREEINFDYQSSPELELKIKGPP